MSVGVIDVKSQFKSEGEGEGEKKEKEEGAAGIA